jgi:hypothetical protein
VKSILAEFTKIGKNPPRLGIEPRRLLGGGGGGGFKRNRLPIFREFPKTTTVAHSDKKTPLGGFLDFG